MIVLTGPSGSGKSSLIERVLQQYGDASGYRTRREVTDSVTSFFLVPIQPDDTLPHKPFLTSTPDRATFFPEIFRHAAAASIRPDSRLIILDEVGGLELLSAAVFEWLLGLKNSPSVLLLVFKSDKNLRRLLAKASLLQPEEALLRERREALLAGVSHIYEVTGAEQLFFQLEAAMAEKGKQ